MVAVHSAISEWQVKAGEWVGPFASAAHRCLLHWLRQSGPPFLNRISERAFAICRDLPETLSRAHLSASDITWYCVRVCVSACQGAWPKVFARSAVAANRTARQYHCVRGNMHRMATCLGSTFGSRKSDLSRP